MRRERVDLSQAHGAQPGGSALTVLGGQRGCCAWALCAPRPVVSSLPGPNTAPLATLDAASSFRISQTRRPSAQGAHPPEPRVPDSKGSEGGPQGAEGPGWCYGRHHCGTRRHLDHCLMPRDNNPGPAPGGGAGRRSLLRKGDVRGPPVLWRLGAALQPMPVAGVGD